MSSQTTTPAARAAFLRRTAETPYRAALLRRIRQAYTDFYLSRRDYIKRLKKEAVERAVMVPPLGKSLTTLQECTIYELSNIARDFECKAREMAQRYEALINGFSEELEKKHREEFERWQNTIVYNCRGHPKEEQRPSNCEDGYEGENEGIELV